MPLLKVKSVLKEVNIFQMENFIRTLNTDFIFIKLNAITNYKLLHHR